MVRQATRLRLTQEREARGWSKTDLARRARIQNARLGQIERGQAIPPQGSVELLRLAMALDHRGDPDSLLEPVAEPASAEAASA
jgi:ribosome-binding protein aMBF1 (putative translation factor)